LKKALLIFKREKYISRQEAVFYFKDGLVEIMSAYKNKLACFKIGSVFHSNNSKCNLGFKP